MAFFSTTNERRVEKIIETLHFIRKSADVNNASNEDVWKLLRPVVDLMTDLLDAEAQEPKEKTDQALPDNLSVGQKAALMLASQASTRELVCSLIARLESYQQK